MKRLVIPAAIVMTMLIAMLTSCQMKEEVPHNKVPLHPFKVTVLDDINTSTIYCDSFNMESRTKILVYINGASGWVHGDYISVSNMQEYGD